MKLKSFELFSSRLACKKPFKIATGSSNVCRALVLRLTSDTGHTGLGEAVPHPLLTGETLEGAAACITRYLMPAVESLDLRAPRDVARALRAVTTCPAARTAVDLAVHDLLGRACGLPVACLLGGGNRPVRTNYSIGLTSPREAAEEARSLIEQGWRCIKLKVGDDPEVDVARVRAVRGAIGPDMALRIDANEGWSLAEAVRTLRAMEPFQVELAEQPLARWDLAGHASLRSRTTIPIALDESVHSVADARRALELGAADIINVKLMKSGGLVPAVEIATLARAHGVAMMVGGMVGESALSVSAAASLASALRFEFADLDADLLLRDVLSAEGARLEGDARVPAERPGFGIENLDEQYLERLA